MSIEIIGLILLAALLHATWNVIIKGGENKFYEISLNTLGGGVGALFCLPFLPFPHIDSLYFMAGSATVHIAYYLCVAQAYRYVDMSYAYTLMRGSAPLITSLVMLFFGSELTLLGWAGVLVISLGILSLTLGTIQQGNFNLKGTLAALSTALVVMGYTIFDGFGARASGNALSYVCYFFAINAIPLNLILLFKDKTRYVRYLKMRFHYGLFGGVCSLASYGVALYAMTFAPIALVAALRETSVIFGMILAIIFLGEKLTWLKCISISLVACGVMLAKTF